MNLDFDLNNFDIQKLVADIQKFNSFVYTPLAIAKKQLEDAWKNDDLGKKIEDYLEGDIPSPLVHNFKAVLFRQLFTPNFEFKKFMEVIKNNNLEPMFLEYLDDKFTSNNSLKHSLGKIRFLAPLLKKEGARVTYLKVIDFNQCDGQKIKDIKTQYNQSLVDFHHSLLELIYPNSKKYLFDTSDWFHRKGKNAKEYYNRYMALFIRNGILFENFVLEGNELSFIKEVFLPSFIDVWKKIGIKPKIVSLLPLDSHNHADWISHPIETFNCIKSRKEV